jgi:hypothetical protein
MIYIQSLNSVVGAGQYVPLYYTGITGTVPNTGIALYPTLSKYLKTGDAIANFLTTGQAASQYLAVSGYFTGVGFSGVKNTLSQLVPAYTYIPTGYTTGVGYTGVTGYYINTLSQYFTVSGYTTGVGFSGLVNNLSGFLTTGQAASQYLALSGYFTGTSGTPLNTISQLLTTGAASQQYVPISGYFTGVGFSGIFNTLSQFIQVSGYVTGVGFSGYVRTLSRYLKTGDAASKYVPRQTYVPTGYTTGIGYTGVTGYYIDTLSQYLAISGYVTGTGFSGYVNNLQNFLSTGIAALGYLSQEDASNTYLSLSQASGQYIPNQYYKTGSGFSGYVSTLSDYIPVSTYISTYITGVGFTGTTGYYVNTLSQYIPAYSYVPTGYLTGAGSGSNRVTGSIMPTLSQYIPTLTFISKSGFTGYVDTLTNFVSGYLTGANIGSSTTLPSGLVYTTGTQNLGGNYNITGSLTISGPGTTNIKNGLMVTGNITGSTITSRGRFQSDFNVNSYALKSDGYGALSATRFIASTSISSDSTKIQSDGLGNLTMNSINSDNGGTPSTSYGIYSDGNGNLYVQASSLGGGGGNINAYGNIISNSAISGTAGMVDGYNIITTNSAAFNVTPTVNGTGVLLSGQAPSVNVSGAIVFLSGTQTISGQKTFSSPLILSGSGSSANDIIILPVTAQSSGSVYVQVQNISGSLTSSADLVIKNDSGLAYIDVGVRSSKYDGTKRTPQFTVVSGNDSYVYASGGNLAIGVWDIVSGKRSINFFVGTGSQQNIDMSISGGVSGIGVPSVNFNSLPTVNGTGVLLVGQGSSASLPYGLVYTTGTQVLSGAYNFTGAYLQVSGNSVLTGVDLSSYATITNLASTGSTLATNLASTGSTLAGSISALSGTVTGSYYPRNNPSGFITGLSINTGSFLTTGAAALQYYPLSNPSGFITGGGGSSYNQQLNTYNSPSFSGVTVSTLNYYTGNAVVKVYQFYNTGTQSLDTVFN